MAMTMEAAVSPREVCKRNTFNKFACFGLRSVNTRRSKYADSGKVDLVQRDAGDSTCGGSSFPMKVNHNSPLTKPLTVNMLLQATKVAPALMNSIWLMPPSPPVYSNHYVQPDCVGNSEIRASSDPSAVCQFACLGGIAALSQNDVKYHGFMARENTLQSDLSACPVKDRLLSSSQLDCQRREVTTSTGAICDNNGSSSPRLTFLVDAHGDYTRKPPQTQRWVSNELSLDDDTFASAEGTQLEQQLPFQLNFYYSRRLSPAQSVRRNDSGAAHHPKTQFDDDISTVSSTDEFDAVACGAASNETFAKYIPLLKTCPPRVPKILLNKRNRNEWKDIQKAFIQNSSAARPMKSHSDTNLSLPKVMSANSWKKKFRTGRYADMSEQKPQDFDTGQLSALKKKYPGRFDLAVNEKFCKLNVCKKPDLTAVLYIQLPTGDEKTLNLKLCHMKTELAVAAMLHFLYPYSQVQCLWVQCLQDNIDEFLRDVRIKPKFSKFVYLRHFDAILVLSDDAAGLLRHTDTCFVRALAAAIGVSSDQLLVLVWQKPLVVSESFD